jgi:hypothetical protein
MPRDMLEYCYGEIYALLEKNRSSKFFLISLHLADDKK